MLQCHLVVIFDWQTCPGMLSLHGKEPWRHAATVCQIMRLFIEGRQKSWQTDNWLKVLEFKSHGLLKWKKSSWHKNPAWCSDSWCQSCCQLLLDAWHEKYIIKTFEVKQWGFTKNDNGTINMTHKKTSVRNCSNTELGLDFKMEFKLLSFLVQKWSSTGALNAWWPLIRFGYFDCIPSLGLNSNVILFNI